MARLSTFKSTTVDFLADYIEASGGIMVVLSNLKIENESLVLATFLKNVKNGLNEDLLKKYKETIKDENTEISKRNFEVYFNKIEHFVKFLLSTDVSVPEMKKLLNQSLIDAAKHHVDDFKGPLF